MDRWACIRWVKDTELTSRFLFSHNFSWVMTVSRESESCADRLSRSRHILHDFWVVNEVLPKRGSRFAKARAENPFRTTLGSPSTDIFPRRHPSSGHRATSKSRLACGVCTSLIGGYFHLRMRTILYRLHFSTHAYDAVQAWAPAPHDCARLHPFIHTAEGEP